MSDWHDQVIIGDEAEEILPASDFRKEVAITNMDSSVLYLGTKNVTPENGFPLLQNQAIVMAMRPEVFGVREEGNSGLVAYLEVLP